jgi:hypothetical protein
MSGATMTSSVLWASGGIAEIDPSTLSLTGWWKNWGGSSPWSGSASAGVSGDGSHDLVAGDIPATTTLNSLNVADFDGTADTLLGEGTLDSYFNTSVVCGLMLVNSDVSQSRTLLADTSSQVHVRISATEALFEIDNLGTAASVSRAFTHSAWQLITFRFDGANLQVGVNESPGASGGGSTEVRTDPISSLSNQPGVAKQPGGVSFYNGKIAEIILTDQALTDVQFAGLKLYINNRYALSL